nr:alpha/beta hydrolase [Streptomyces albus]
MRKLDPEQFGQAADGYRVLGSMADEAKGRVQDHIVGKIDRGLGGLAAKAAKKALRGLGNNFHYVQAECGLVRAALNALAAELRAAKKKFDAAEEDARTAHFKVNLDGSVTYPPAGEEVDGRKPEGGTVHGKTGSKPTGGPIDPAADANMLAESLEKQADKANPNPNHHKAVEIADRIAEALEEATIADRKWAPKLRALKADDDLHVSRKDWTDVTKDMRGVRAGADDYLKPPKKGSPKENAAWWEKLSKEQQDDYVALYPASIGGMDGLPAAARDEANRTVLAEAKAKYQLELDKLPPEPRNKYSSVSAGGATSQAYTDEWIAWNKKYGERYRHLKSSLSGMRAIEGRFEATGKEGLPDAYLLGFKPEGHGRAIVANGNPDEAVHQAVYVPGTTANLGDIEKDMDRMKSVWREAQPLTGGAPVSTITWLGYDAPQNVVTDSPSPRYANDGASAFDRFNEGLEASHAGDGSPHRTAIGHSYGTTLIGSAARQGNLNADDVIFAGSPGVQVGSAKEMDVPKGHVWNEEAEGDVVPDIGRYGHGGSQWKMGGGVWLNPSDEEFGAHQLNTGADEWNGRKTEAAHGHSDYWDENTTSLKNQARVVAGRHGDVHLDD